MNSKLTQSWALPPTWLRFLVIIVLVMGVFFRCVNLDRKIYWYDESFTSLRVSGYKEAELIQQASDRRILSIEDIQKFQRVNAECVTSSQAKVWCCLAEVQVTPKPKHRLTLQIDELWSFVNDKDQEQWVWLAMDADTREIVGC